jgi:hypothetical protein
VVSERKNRWEGHLLHPAEIQDVMYFVSLRRLSE